MTSASVLERSRKSEIAKAARREEILAAARRVFARCGFRGTTIADIADEAGIALGTIYLYFPSKQDVFAALNQEFNTLIVAAMTDVPPAVSLDQTVRQRVDNVFRTCEANRDLVRLVVLNADPGSSASESMRAADTERDAPMAAAFEAAMNAGAIRTGDSRIMARLVTGLVSIAVYQAFILADGRDADQYRVACGDMIVSYLTPQP